MATKAHELNSASPERVAYSENSPLLSENQVKGSNEISQDISTQIGRIDNSSSDLQALSDQEHTYVTSAPNGLARTRTPYLSYILLGMFCCLAFAQNSVFVEWNPIANSALAVFGPEWSPSTLAWQINLATIISPIIQWPVWLAIQKYDLSRTIRWGAVFPLFVSAAISYIPLATSDISNLSYKWLTYAAYFFTGITGVVFFSSITRFSRVWFPQEQRATSTGLLCTSANLGGLLPAIVGPLMVTEPTQQWIENNENEKHNIKDEIALYLLIYFVLSLALLCAYLIYFPQDTTSEIFVNSLSTETRTSITNENGRTSNWNTVWNNFTTVLRCPTVIYIMILQSLSTLPHIWGTTLLTVTLKPLGVSQKSIGILIIATTLVSFIATLLSARFADIFFRFRLKVLILILLALHSLAMICLSVAALSHGSKETNKYIVFVSYVLGISFLNSVSPLVYELLAEISYPVPEDIINGLCNQCNNIFGIIFYFTFSTLSLNSGSSSKDNYTWLLYALMSVPAVVTILFIFVKERYTRSEETTNIGISDFSTNIVQVGQDRNL